MNMSKKKHYSENLIDLKDFGQKYTDAGKFEQAVLKTLGRKIFEFHSMEALYFGVLSSIKQTKDVELNEISIEGNIEIVLEHFGFNKIPKASITNLSTGKTNSEERSKKSYFNLLLGISELPYNELAVIKGEVESHLNYFNDLIQHYESLSEVKDLLNEGKRSEYSESRTIIHFYSRCLEERQAILNYYLHGMYTRALQKSRHEKGSLFATMTLLSDFNHRPYEFGRSVFGRNYDYRILDCSTHRLILSNVAMNKYMDFRKLYKSDKEKFYEDYFELRGVEKIFKSIDRNLALLPVSPARKNIFEELKRFFISGEWLAFYAIALPQVEGLFSEMLESDNTNSAGKNALSAKVRKVRSWFIHNEKNLDYYEYSLPKYRNKFAHGVLLDDIKLLAYDLLTDLDDVLDLFSGAEKPSIKVSRTIRRKNEVDFRELSMYGNFFKAVNSLTQKMKTDLEEEIKDFTNGFLLPNKKALVSLVNERLQSYEIAKAQMNECLVEVNLPELGKVDDLSTKFESEVQEESLYKENLTLFVDAYDLNLFFKYFKVYKKKYITDKELLKEELDQWTKEYRTIQNIEQFEDRRE